MTYVQLYVHRPCIPTFAFVQAMTLATTRGHTDKALSRISDDGVAVRVPMIPCTQSGVSDAGIGGRAAADV